MSDPIRPRTWTERLYVSIARARFLTVSIFIHAIILIAASSIVIFKAYMEAPDFVAGGEFVGSEDGPVAPPETQAAPVEEVQPDIKIAASSPMDVIASTASNSNFRVASANVSRIGTGVEGTSERVAGLGKGMGAGMGGGMAGGTMLSFMGTKAKATSAIFVVDVSGSMITGTKSVKTYEVLEREIIKVVKSFAETMQFGLVVFSKDAKTYQPKLVRATSVEKERALNWLKKLSPEQWRDPKADEEERQFHHGTRADRGLEEAFAMQPDVIFFVSDGEPTGARPPQILAQVQAAQKNVPKPVVINVVAYCADSGQKFMKDLAQQNQGAFREVNPKDVD
jgi:hypothetical protein